MSQQAIAARSPLSVVFLLHVALEIPLAIQGLWSPASLPFLQLNNTTLVILKLYAALVAGSCATAFLCFSLPEFLPGKRAFAIGLCLYHSVCSTILIQTPRFIPHSFGPLLESFKFTPEILWGGLHGVLSLAFLAWWQGTVQYAAMARKMQ
ncbi:hypothetical protein PLICRDRAFT_162334 [Plicaturopsis crispa FD-325 SS-3]|nr:hypothetical protein PLICRDRAFT_162334 [Plicaturopsis crispa FD-325 SS-3]